MKKLNLISKIIPIICFLGVFLEAYLINMVGGTSQYEVSIYSPYPNLFWVLMVMIFFLTFLNVFLFIEKKSSYLSVVLTLIAAVNSLSFLLLLPFFRDYFFFNPFDSLTHLGYVNDIFMTGYFSVNYYPLIHIFIYSVAAFCQVDPKTVFFFIPLFFNILFIASVFILVRSVNKKLALIITAFAIVPVLANSTTYVTPSGMVFFLIPIFLYLFLMTRTVERNLASYSILMVLFLLMLPIFHMEVAVLLIIILIAVYLYFRFGRSRKLVENLKGNSRRLMGQSKDKVGKLIEHVQGNSLKLVEQVRGNPGTQVEGNTGKSINIESQNRIQSDIGNPGKSTGPEKEYLHKLKLFIKRNSILEIEIMFIIIFTWFSFSVIFGSTVKEVLAAFFLNSQLSSAQILQNTSLASITVITAIIKLFGANLFFIGISLLILLFIFIFKKRRFGPVYGPLGLMYIFLVFLNFLTFFKGLILG
ncbi:MAG: hypothetical protein LUQ24_02190, partial [Methanobacterium sp.]|nr:hypothetical protein [Methanobacterium sp.]